MAGVVRVIAPNPSAMTGDGTNTYVLGLDHLTVIDPGPDNPHHLAQLLSVIGDRPVDRIVVTHSHLDHSGLARPLARATGARVLGFGDSLAGRSPVMQRLAATGLIRGGEGIDTAFSPDQRVADGEVIDTGIGPLRVVHTPGHLGNHICLGLGDIVFSGDHVMGWSTSIVSPPDGDLTDFMASLTRLKAQGARLLLPGHGAAITDPSARIAWLIAHRHSREAQLIAALKAGPRRIRELTEQVYADIPPAHLAAAARNVLAHLIDLEGKRIVRAIPTLSETAVFALE